MGEFSGVSAADFSPLPQGLLTKFQRVRSLGFLPLLLRIWGLKPNLVSDRCLALILLLLSSIASLQCVKVSPLLRFLMKFVLRG